MSNECTVYNLRPMIMFTVITQRPTVTCSSVLPSVLYRNLDHMTTPRPSRSRLFPGHSSEKIFRSCCQLPVGFTRLLQAATPDPTDSIDSGLGGEVSEPTQQPCEKIEASHFRSLRFGTQVDLTTRIVLQYSLCFRSRAFFFG